MPWLVLLLVFVWLLERSGWLGGRRTKKPTTPTAPPDARQAASAWSSYVPMQDEPEVPLQADGSPRDPYDDIPDRSSGIMSDSDAVPERAYLDADVEADGVEQSEVEVETTGLDIDEGSPQPGAGAIVDPADQPRVDPTSATSATSPTDD